MKNADRLFARMLLTIGLTATISSAVVCGVSHPKFSGAKNTYLDALDAKNAYLDAYEQTNEFKSIYTADVAALNDRLIAREITGETFDKQLEKLNTNEYTEKVLVENANASTKAGFDKINQYFLDVNDRYNDIAVPAIVGACTTCVAPLLTAELLIINKLSNKNETDEKTL